VKRTLDALKEGVTRDLGLDDDLKRRGFAGMTMREVGKIGGQMVKRLIRRGERDLGREEAEKQDRDV